MASSAHIHRKFHAFITKNFASTKAYRSATGEVVFKYKFALYYLHKKNAASADLENYEQNDDENFAVHYGQD